MPCLGELPYPPLYLFDFNKKKDRNAFTLIEVLIAIMVFSIAVVGLLGAIQFSQRSLNSISRQVQAHEVANEIYEEIAALPRSREIADGVATRAEFRSPLDYANLEESPPRDPLGAPIPGCNNFKRVVKIDFVDPDDSSQIIEASNLLAINVAVFDHDKEIHSIRFLRSLED